MNPRLQRQISVYATLLGLTIVWRAFVPDMSGEALGGLLFLALAGGVGVNYLFDEGYRTWAVVLICVSMVGSATSLFGLMFSEGFFVALFIGALLFAPCLIAFRWGQVKTSRKMP